MCIRDSNKHKAVLLYDTEQSEVQLFKNVSNLLARAKQPNKPEELKAFCLTGMSRKERLHAIVQSMDKFYYQYGGIQLVVIDGIADLVKSANDEVESVAVIDEPVSYTHLPSYYVPLRSYNLSNIANIRRMLYNDNLTNDANYQRITDAKGIDELVNDPFP